MKWKHLKDGDFDREKDCTILVPSFYGYYGSRLDGKVREVTIYVYKADTGEFYDHYDYTVKFIPFDKMNNETYINLDEIEFNI